MLCLMCNDRTKRAESRSYKGNGVDIRSVKRQSKLKCSSEHFEEKELLLDGSRPWIHTDNYPHVLCGFRAISVFKVCDFTQEIGYLTSQESQFSHLSNLYDNSP